MTPSDIIAIVAITASATLSIISAFISYKNNQANISAKRSEMAYEKQLNAFQETVEKIGVVRRILAKNAHLKNEESIKTYFLDLRKAHEEFYNSFQKQRVYLPPDIAEKVRYYGSSLFSFTQKHDYEEHSKCYPDLVKSEQEIVKKIQDYIGYKKEQMS